ncbi:DUF1592 domain-containing protein [Stieleria sp. TO1_6]|uniref:DUF1588 domain-containing protein n=1 Tax=Stieleria tagensis TaxID=2956795 RepID=UPI00209A6C8B|nr:DUF1588 domain-containing protein [Stieleria tagensis]MCO8122843.1 DUF1592 domain-containing protein [Stieleria tagensis]
MKPDFIHHSLGRAHSRQTLAQKTLAEKTWRVVVALLTGLSFATASADVVAANPDATSPAAGNRVPTAKAADKGLMPFLRENCIDCHDGTDGEGGFDLNSLRHAAQHGLTNANDMHRWVRVFDRISSGEMPPEEYGELDGKPKAAFLKAASQWMDQSQSAEFERLGRVRSRRLTNDQLQSTLCDLLSIDVPLARLMPEEPRTDGFRNIADSQSMSHYHLEDHLRVIDTALDIALDRAKEQSNDRVLSMPATRIANKRKGQRNRDPELRQGAAVIWSSDMAFYGRISHSRLDQAGWYRITLDASSIKAPKDKNLWCSIRSGECSSRSPLMHWIGSFEATSTPDTYVFDAWIEAGHMLEIRPADNTIKKAKFKGGQVGVGEAEPQDVPGVAMHQLTIQRIYPGGKPQDVRDSLFGELKVHWDTKVKRFLLDSKSPGDDLSAQLKTFATAAFRRSVTTEMLAPYQQMIDDGLQQQADPIETLIQTYRAVLCSPRFVYFTESPGRLDDDAVANRLSYLLTGRAPDQTLRDLATAGKLSDPQVIVAQTRRLLQGENLQRFVHDFADQWLDLADISFTEPDRRMYREFDLVVQNAMLGETYRYLETALQENLPARVLVDSDFTWLNDRLARYYEIDCDIEPNQWQRVSLADHPFRGGLMTHGSILKVTANGSNTSPVVRGVWVCDRLLGFPIPDPPENIPAIEPDVRGATTVRQMLEKHRSQTECAACHAKIDPPGFALEHFDAAGRWRDHYITRKNKSLKPGPKVDSAYELADGRPFDSFYEFRDLAATLDDQVARNFAAKVLTYGTGRDTSFSDRKALDNIVAQTRAEHFPLRSLIEAVVTSQPFLNK